MRVAWNRSKLGETDVHEDEEVRQFALGDFDATAPSSAVEPGGRASRPCAVNELPKTNRRQSITLDMFAFLPVLRAAF